MVSPVDSFKVLLSLSWVINIVHPHGCDDCSLSSRHSPKLYASDCILEPYVGVIEKACFFLLDRR